MILTDIKFTDGYADQQLILVNIYYFSHNYYLRFYQRVTCLPFDRRG